MNEIVQYQRDLFTEFTKKYMVMISKLDKLNNENIEMLNKFNNDFRVTIDVLDELNVYLEDDKNEVVKKKLKEYKEMEDTIKQFTPFLLVNTMLKSI